MDSQRVAPLILTGMNVELVIPYIDKILLTGKNSKLVVHGNVGTLQTKTGLICVSQSIKTASSILGVVCCDDVSYPLPWTPPLLVSHQPQITITSTHQECLLLHDCSVIINGNAFFIMTSSEDVKIDGKCESIDTVCANICLTSRNIGKVLQTTGVVRVPSTCDVSGVRSADIQFVDTCVE